MIAAIVGESTARKQEKISRGLVTFVALGCFILQIMLVYMLRVSMLKTQPLESQMPLGSALLALLISVVGAFVTYSFPAQEVPQNQIPPAGTGGSHSDARSGKNGRHALAGLFRQSVFGRLAGYEDVNDAERLRHDPAMRWIVADVFVRYLTLDLECFE
jgi:hypothetical protein